MNARWGAVLVVALLAAACAALPPVQEQSLPAELQACMVLYRKLDEAIDAALVRDAQEHRLDGFPYLRVNRFVASHRDAALTDRAAAEALIQGMLALDQAARRHEIANLPPGAPRELAAELPRCGAKLAAHDAADAVRRAAILARVEVPDRYAGWKRALGVYPLSSRLFRLGVDRWEADTRAAFANPDAGATPLRYAPRESDTAAGAGRETLLHRHAPRFVIDTGSAADRFGAPRWRDGGLAIDTASPVVYGQLTTTRFAGENLLQLVYTLWFPERPAAGAIDLYSGHLDGLIVRVTLDRDGEILIADSIHACGCYHLFFPGPRLAARPAPSAHLEWAFVPATLPALAPGQRLEFRVARGTHYLTGIGAAQAVAGSVEYQIRDAEMLRSLPVDDGATRRSLYGPDGFIAGSERAERWLFWPMGILSPGAMRQWGHHATAFVGRRHFDDADLIDLRFRRIP